MSPANVTLLPGALGARRPIYMRPVRSRRIIPKLCALTVVEITVQPMHAVPIILLPLISPKLRIHNKFPTHRLYRGTRLLILLNLRHLGYILASNQFLVMFKVNQFLPLDMADRVIIPIHQFQYKLYLRCLSHLLAVRLPHPRALL